MLSSAGRGLLVKDFPIIYVFLNKSLNMSVGKASSQAVHAVMAVSANKLNLEWSLANTKTVIVLEARDDTHIRNISNYLDNIGIKNSLVIDEGMTEVPPYSITALGVEVLSEVNADKDILEIFKKFDLYKNKKKRKLLKWITTR